MKPKNSPDGSTTPASSRRVPLREPEQSPQTLLQLLEDQQRATEALRESESRIRAIVNSSLDGIITIDHQGCIVDINAAATTMFGLNPNEVVGQELATVAIPEKFRGQHRTGFLRLLQTGESRIVGRRIETVGRRANGEEFPIELTVTRIQASDPPLFVGHVRDITEQKNAIAAVEESEARYADLYQNSPDMMLSIDSRDATILECNDTLLRVLGRSKQELIGRSVFEIYAPESATEAREVFFPEFQRTGRVVGQEISLQCADGTIRRAVLNATAYRDSQGNIIASRSVLRDVTELRQAQIDRDRLFNNSLDLLCVADLHGRFQRINPSVSRLLGFTDQELVGRTFVDFVHPDDLEATRLELQNLAQGIDSVYFENRYICKDGSLLYLAWSCAAPQEGSSTLYAVARDITERKLAEQALNESESRYREIFTSVTDGLVIVDPESGIIDANPAAYEMFGYTREEFTGLHPMTFIHPDHRYRYEDFVCQASTGADYEGEGVGLTKKGESIDVEVTGTTITVLGKKRLLAIIRNVTQRKAAAYALELQGKIFQAVSHAATQWLQATSPHTELESVLIDLAQALNVSHAYIYELIPDDAGSPQFCCRADWSNDLGVRDHQSLRLYSKLSPISFPRWLEALGANQVICGPVDKFPEHERQLLTGRGVQSIGVIPVLVANSLWGFIGFEECGSGREWSNVEISALRVAAETLGAAIRRSQSEAALRVSQARYRAVVEDQTELIARWRPDGVRTFVNDAYCRYFGRSREDLLGTSDFPMAKAEDWNQLKQNLAQLTAQHPICSADYQVRLPDGRSAWQNWIDRALFDDHGRLVGYQSVGRDITRQKVTEQALHESEGRLRLFIAHAPVAIAMFDKQMRYIAVSNRWKSDHHLGEIDINGRSHYAVVPDTSQRWKDIHQRGLQGQIIRTNEDRTRRSDGSEQWLRWEVRPWYADDGGVGGIVIFTEDITDRKTAEHALRELNTTLETKVEQRTAKLAETNEELASFAYTVSHDLRAPLRAMEGFAQALNEDYGDQLDSDGREFIQHIIDSAKRLDTLVNDLLAYSRLGRTELRVAPVALRNVVDDALQQIKTEILQLDAELEIADALPSVLAHPATLVQMMANLLSNAIKFVGAGVRPRISLWTELRDEGKIRICIQDNGIGIDPEHHDRVFRAFERLHGIEQYPGTGIGLAMVARACERLGGRYGLESKSNEGSLFWVELQGDPSSHRARTTASTQN